MEFSPVAKVAQVTSLGSGLDQHLMKQRPRILEICRCCIDKSMPCFEQEEIGNSRLCHNVPQPKWQAQVLAQLAHLAFPGHWLVMLQSLALPPALQHSLQKRPSAPEWWHTAQIDDCALTGCLLSYPRLPDDILSLRGEIWGGQTLTPLQL